MNLTVLFMYSRLAQAPLASVILSCLPPCPSPPIEPGLANLNSDHSATCTYSLHTYIPCLWISLHLCLSLSARAHKSGRETRDSYLTLSSVQSSHSTKVSYYHTIFSILAKRFHSASHSGGLLQKKLSTLALP